MKTRSQKMHRRRANKKRSTTMRKQRGRGFFSTLKKGFGKVKEGLGGVKREITPYFKSYKNNTPSSNLAEAQRRAANRATVSRNTTKKFSYNMTGVKKPEMTNARLLNKNPNVRRNAITKALQNARLQNARERNVARQYSNNNNYNNNNYNQMSYKWL